MVRKVIHRIAAASCALIAATAVALSAGAAPASAAATVRPAGAVRAVSEAGAVRPAGTSAPRPAAGRPDAVRVVGDDLPQGVLVNAVDRPVLFDVLLNEVNWLTDAVPLPAAPNQKTLGAKYTLVVLARNVPQHTYDLYPLAKGGPRAYRPARQPTGGTRAGWFFGRLSMTQSLRAAGAPLPDRPDGFTGGIGGGEEVDAAITPSDPAKDVAASLTELRGLVLLNGAVAVLIATGLAGLAYLVRRRV